MTEWDLPASVEEQTIERVGGGGYAWKTGVHKAKIKLVHLSQAASKAVGFNIELENADGKTMKETLWIKSGDKKGNKTFYTDKDGKDRPLPGYSVANSLCVAATGDSLGKVMGTAGNIEKKTIKLYNFEAGKEVETEVNVVTALLGLPVTVAVHNVLEDKNKKNAAGQYEPTGQTRTSNETKFFGNAEGQTAEEILSGSEATMFDAWAAKNTAETVIDKTAAGGTNKGATSAADIMGGGAATAGAATTDTASLFN